MSTTTRQNHIPTTSRLQTNATVIPCDIPKMRQPPRSAATPSVPRALALSDEEREQLQIHLDLVGIDKYHFEHTLQDQSEAIGEVTLTFCLLRVRSVWIPHLATPAKKKTRFPVDKCDRGVFSSLSHDTKLRFQIEIAQPKIYTSPDMYFFFWNCNNSVSIWHLPDRDIMWQIPHMEFALNTLWMSFIQIMHSSSSMISVCTCQMTSHTMLAQSWQSRQVIQTRYAIGPDKKYTWWTRLYQCLCGTDNEAGRWPSKHRQIPWENVKCSLCARVISTHDERNPKSIMHY